MERSPGWTSDANPHLYVHNVPKDSNEEELRSIFGQFGQVVNVRLKVNQKVGPHAVYAFVTFTTTDEAQNALMHLQGQDISKKRNEPGRFARL
ncbi:RNA-binding protein [Gregarina niphandrodes]|uniref:RNA-binding protein n=1 Tax=Gregarina niphandrodes TaxID=110365 RepID=A0A023BC31_GRENI|nr:RNA-binding protein [Gregarina niphandrodes]EZG81482.1 RNA-binding protein [Gregarina niphandrodes]|eukprot:XP_011134227.1 RNA-binding protein [Gregarina niphandrodes]